MALAAQLVNLDLANKPKVSAKQWKLQRVLALDVKVAKWVGDFFFVFFFFLQGDMWMRMGMGFEEQRG